LYAVLGGVAAVALIVVLIVAFSGGGGDDDDDTTTTRNPTTTSGQTTSTFGSSTTGTGTITTLAPTEYQQVLFDCAGGDMAECDHLYRNTPFGGALETFAKSCGGRDTSTEHTGDCESSFGADGSGAPISTTTTTEVPQSQISACTDSAAACDDLYRSTGIDTAADIWANSCGGRDPGGEHNGDCEEQFG
jgi:hypothetical protein